MKILVDDELKLAEEYAKKQAAEEARMRKSMWAIGEEIGEEDEQGGEIEDETQGKAGEENQEGKSSRRKRKKKASSHKIVDTKKKKQHEKSEEEEVWVEPSYDSSEFVSGPILTPDSDLNVNTLRM